MPVSGGDWAAPIASLMMEQFLTGSISQVEKEETHPPIHLPLSRNVDEAITIRRTTHRLVYSRDRPQP